MKKCVLGDVARSIQTGPFGSQLHQSDYTDCGTPVVMPKDVVNGDIVDTSIARVGPQHVSRLSRHQLRPGNLIFSRRGDVGRCALVKKEQNGWLCGTGCLRVVVDEEKINSSYLYYFLCQSDVAKWLESHAVGAIMLNINPSIVSQIPISFPTRGAQEQIANLLSALDRKIALNRRKIATLEKMAKEIYDYWFVQYDFPDANGRPYKSSGGEMVYSPELKREIPKGWKVDALSSFCEVVNGATPSTSTIGNYGGDIVWITPKDLSDQGQKFIACGERCITKLGYESCSTHMIPKGSLLMSSRAPIGLLAMAACELCTNQGFKNLVPNDMSDRFYLYYYLQSHMSQIEQLGSGTTFKEVSREAISKYPILYVTDQMVRKRWVDFISPIFGRQMVMQDEADRLIALRDFLLPLLMNGQARIGDAAE